jgi:hypothetical protein
MTAQDKKKLAQLTRRLKAAQGDYKATETQAERLTARIQKAGDLVLGVGIKAATGTREKKLQASYARDQKALKAVEKKLLDLEEKAASLKDNAQKLRAKNPASWTAKQERQYKAIEKSEMKSGRSKKTSKRIAAATVNKRRGRNPQGAYRVSAVNISTGKREVWPLHHANNAGQAIRKIKADEAYWQRAAGLKTPKYRGWKAELVKRNPSAKEARSYRVEVLNKALGDMVYWIDAYNESEAKRKAIREFRADNRGHVARSGKISARVIARNPSAKSTLKKAGKAAKGAVKSALKAGSKLFKAGSKAIKNPDYPYWNVYLVDTKLPKDHLFHKTFVGSSNFHVSKQEAIEQFKRSHYPSRMKPGKKLIAEKAVIQHGNPEYSVQGKPKWTDSVNEKVSAFTRGAAIRKGQKKAAGPKNAYKWWVARNPAQTRRLRHRNAYIDLVIYGQAEYTPKGWKVGNKTFAQGKGTVKVSSHYWLDKATGFVYAKRERNAAGFKDESGQFHPIRSGMEATSSGLRKSRKAYRPSAVGEKSTYSAKKAAKRGAQSSRLKKSVASRKATASRLAGRSLRKSSGMLKNPRGFYKVSAINVKTGKREYFGYYGGQTAAQVIRTVKADVNYRRDIGISRGTYRNWKAEYEKKDPGLRNPSATSIRKKFAGRANGSRDLYFPKGAPNGMAKLGRLVSIKVKGKTIKPARRNPSPEIWLCCDTNGKLWLGSTKQGPLYAGAPGDLGEMRMIEYAESKPHLGYKNETIWFHKMGEESGRRPHLVVNDDNDLIIKGGAYRITRAGIVN